VKIVALLRTRYFSLVANSYLINSPIYFDNISYFHATLNKESSKQIMNKNVFELRKKRFFKNLV